MKKRSITALICGLLLVGVLIAVYFLYPRRDFKIEVEGTRIINVSLSNGVDIATRSDLHIDNPNYVPIDIMEGSYVELLLGGQTISSKEDNRLTPLKLKSRETNTFEGLKWNFRIESTDTISTLQEMCKTTGTFTVEYRAHLKASALFLSAELDESGNLSTLVCVPELISFLKLYDESPNALSHLVNSITGH